MHKGFRAIEFSGANNATPKLLDEDLRPSANDQSVAREYSCVPWHETDPPNGGAENLVFAVNSKLPSKI